MDRNLLVPGTGGCRLMLDGEDLGWPGYPLVDAWTAGATGIGSGLFDLSRSPEELVEILSMEHGDPESTAPTRLTLRNGSKLVPGPVIGRAYNQFREFDGFSYDWRGDVRHSASQLLDHLRAEKPANGRWRILAHSLGGLVTIAASKLCATRDGNDDRAFSKLVSRVSLLATPLLGTVRAAKALISGADLQPPFAEHFRTIVLTWPSIHQMLPAWPGCVRLQTNGSTTPAPYNLMDDNPWMGALSADMLRRAREARQLFREPLACMNEVETQILLATAFDTPNALLLRAGRLLLHDSVERGDGLVPEQTTHKNCGDAERAVMHSFQRPTSRHFIIANDPIVVARVMAFLVQ